MPRRHEKKPVDDRLEIERKLPRSVSVARGGDTTCQARAGKEKGRPGRLALILAALICVVTLSQISRGARRATRR